MVLSGYSSSTTNTGRHDIAEILLKVALNTIKQTNQIYIYTNNQSINQTIYCSTKLSPTKLLIQIYCQTWQPKIWNKDYHKPGPWFSMTHFLVFFMFNDLICACSCCWYWWNCWPSLFKLSFYKCRMLSMSCHPVRQSLIEPYKSHIVHSTWHNGFLWNLVYILTLSSNKRNIEYFFFQMLFIEFKVPYIHSHTQPLWETVHL